MKPVIQQDRTGCAIACVAALTGNAYRAVKQTAASIGIHVSDTALWHDTAHMRRLLEHFHVRASAQRPFASWEKLPDCALLAIKWHVEKTGPAWHWVMFVRDESGSYVLDPKKALRTHRRTDFGRMKPKWFIPVTPTIAV